MKKEISKKKTGVKEGGKPNSPGPGWAAWEALVIVFLGPKCCTIINRTADLRGKKNRDLGTCGGFVSKLPMRPGGYPGTRLIGKNWAEGCPISFL